MGAMSSPFQHPDGRPLYDPAGRIGLGIPDPADDLIADQERAQQREDRIQDFTPVEGKAAEPSSTDRRASLPGAARVPPSPVPPNSPTVDTDVDQAASSLKAAVTSIGRGPSTSRGAAATGGVDPSEQPDWIEFLHWLADYWHLSQHEIVDVVEKPQKFTAEYASFRSSHDPMAA